MNSILIAMRVPPRLGSAGQNIPARLGLSYERRVKESLQRIAIRENLTIEKNPWFAYTRGNTDSGSCSPDILLHGDLICFVVEVKRTYIPEADIKLRGLYVPIVEKILGPGFAVRPVVVASRVTPQCSGRLIETLREAEIGRPQIPVLHWPGRGDVPW